MRGLFMSRLKLLLASDTTPQMTDSEPHSPLMAALEKFETTEANLVKLERLWEEIEHLTPSSVSFGTPPEYEDRLRSYAHVLEALPRIDGWRPATMPMDLDDIAQNRLDAQELGLSEAQVSVERAVAEPGRELREYRFRLNTKRRALIRDALVNLIDQIDEDIRLLRSAACQSDPRVAPGDELWSPLRDHIRAIEVLLGSSVPRPVRWGDMARHMKFAELGDLDDIERVDWPEIKKGLRKGLYGENEALPVGIDDLSDLVATKPSGAIATELNWTKLDDDGFERLIFALIGNELGYENPEWLTRTRAADRGRDLSVMRISHDALAGTTRQRVVIQCKHWLKSSIGIPEVSVAKDQMALWTNPPVDVLVLATSGRFTADAVAWIEQHNSTGVRPRIEMWPESHLERLLAARPALIAEAGLR